MDNIEQGREWRQARDLTEEIDRATDFVVAQERASAERGQLENTEKPEGRITGREQAQRMGWQVMGGDQRERSIGDLKGERLTPAGEVGRDERELTQAEEFVGTESRLQITERIGEDEEDARNEAGEGLGFENRIVAKNQEGVARTVTLGVDKVVAQKSFRPSDLEKLYREGVNSILKVFNRKIGDRN